jgi:hypothetical protein
MQGRDGGGAMRAIDIPGALADDADIAPCSTKSAVFHASLEGGQSCYMSSPPFGYSTASRQSSGRFAPAAVSCISHHPDQEMLHDLARAHA